MRTQLIYESFNAKNIPHKEVGRTFVSNEQFFKVARNNHTLVMGPRGCGKTTMFKMLTQPALHSWEPKNDQEKRLKSDLPFIAVYIPADEMWKEQLDELKQTLISYPKEWIRIREAIFSTNVFLSFIRTVQDYIEFIKIEDGSRKESILAETMKRAFMLGDDVIPNFRGIHKELEFRFQEIFLKVERVLDCEEEGFEDFYRLDYLKTLLPVFSEFGDVYGKRRDQRWALCFDECELIPTELYHRLLRQIRAVPQKVLIKLSTAPTLSFEEFDAEKQSSAKSNHDYDSVLLWPDSAKESGKYQVFCNQIAEQRLTDFFHQKYGIKRKVSPSDIFGEFDVSVPLKALRSVYPGSNRKYFRELIDKNAKKYERNSIEWLAIREYAYMDFEFAGLLEKKKISAEDPISTIKQRDELLRKVIEVVYHRLIFTTYRKISGDKKNRITIGGNTNPQYYFGTKTLLNIVDGNPRYLIGLIDDFTDFLKYDGGNGVLQKIRPKDQNNVFESASNRLFNKFKSVPIVRGYGNVHSSKPNSSLHLSAIIDKVSRYFEKKLLFAKLTADPPSCFVIDKDTSLDIELQKQIKAGVYLGAFIALPKDIAELDVASTRMEGDKYRVTFLLSPKYHIPLRQYKSIGLSKCLQSNEDSDQSSQLKLVD